MAQSLGGIPPGCCFLLGDHSILGLYRDNGKENGNYYSIGVIGLIVVSILFSIFPFYNS